MRDTVWKNALEPATGRVRDPLTGRFMSQRQPWQMGHKPGFEFWKHAASARSRGLTRSEFLDEYMNPASFRPELPTSNMSHRAEDVTDFFLGP